MKKIILMIFFTTSSYFNYSQVIKSIELSNTVDFCKININYSNPNSNQYKGKGVNFNPSVGMTFFKYKYLDLGLLFELKTEGYKEKLPFSIISIDSVFYYTSKNEIDFISFGLKINPKYLITNGITIYANLNPYLNNRILTTNIFDMLIIMDKNDSRKLIPSLNYGLGTMVKVTQNVNFFVEFSANYYFSDILNNDLVNIKINSFGIKIGLYCLINKKEKTNTVLNNFQKTK